MENSLTYIFIGSIGINLFVVFGAMLFIRKVKRDQRRRQQKLVEQAKINTAYEELVKLKDKTIENYRQITGIS